MAQEHLDQFGRGVYHHALQVRNLDEVMKSCCVKGFEIQPVRNGTAGGRIAFFKNPLLPGIYLEFVEPMDN